MIVIRASGTKDVRAVRKLATELGAEAVDHVQEQPDPPPRRRRPTVSPLPGARIAPAAHGAIMELAARVETADRGPVPD